MLVKWVVSNKVYHLGSSGMVLLPRTLANRGKRKVDVFWGMPRGDCFGFPFLFFSTPFTYTPLIRKESRRAAASISMSGSQSLARSPRRRLIGSLWENAVFG